MSAKGNREKQWRRCTVLYALWLGKLGFLPLVPYTVVPYILWGIDALRFVLVVILVVWAMLVKEGDLLCPCGIGVRTGDYRCQKCGRGVPEALRLPKAHS